MNYDTKGLIAWAAKHPPAKEYNWYSINDCFVVMYCRSRAMEHEKRTGKKEVVENYNDCPDAWKVAAMTRPWTFGDVINRLSGIVK